MNLISRMINEADKITYDMILDFIKDRELSNKCWNALQNFKQLSKEDKIKKLNNFDINKSLIESTKSVDLSKSPNVIKLINELKEKIK